MAAFKWLRHYWPSSAKKSDGKAPALRNGPAKDYSQTTISYRFHWRIALFV
jgi:hypothetical protein